MTRKPVIVVGAGSWGTALTMVLANNDYPVYLWGHEEAHIQKLLKQGINEQYLPGIKFPAAVRPVSDFNDPLSESGDIIIAVPCKSLVDVLEQLHNIKDDLNICLACKGIVSAAEPLNHKIVNQILNGKDNTAVLSGPSFASEVANGLPTAVTIASDGIATADYFAGLFHNEEFRIYTSADIIGVQIGGALKNIMAIAAGIADGLGFGANTRSALITRGLAEITRLGVELGGRPETFNGLAGLGDLVLTCTDNQSRNRRLGLALAQGTSLDVAISHIGQAVEGVQTTTEVIKIAQRLSIEMPISEQVHKVLSGQTDPRTAVQHLLSRDPKKEHG
jgi:glycerol-3-phosphate dehydrogenase (NAD(P)+)